MTTDQPTNEPIEESIDEFTEEQITREPTPEEDGEKFKDGQVLRMVRVRFPGNSRSFAFIVGKRKIDYGQKVVAMSDRGMAVGYINSFPYDFTYRDGMPAFKTISKLASEEDIVKDIESYHRQKQVETICQEMIEKHQLDMNFTHVEFTQFGKKAVLYFIAPARVDFRELVKDLVGQLKMRVELRQITVRDRSASIGGIGSCGRELCCSSFLTKYGNAGVKMAKNQDLTLNFSKLNGVCGQLKCCLNYEDEVYAEKRKKLPREGEIIECHNGDKGRVFRLHILPEQFEMLTTYGVRRRYVAEEFKHPIDPNEMPETFDSVSDETKNIIGLEENAKIKTKDDQEEIQKIQKKSHDYVNKTFIELFGVETLDASLPEETEIGSKSKIVLPEEEEEILNDPKDVQENMEELLTEEDDMDMEEEILTKPYDPQPNQNQGRNNNQSRSQNRPNNNNHQRNNNPKGGGGGGRRR